MRIAVVATLLFAFLVNAPSASAQMSFGARTQIWYFMWKDGGALQSSSDTAERMKSRVSELNLDKYAELGATWNIVDVWQQIDGPDGFRRLARVIEEHERRGIQVALRLLEDPEIYAQLSKSNDSATILSEYEKWVSAVAKRFGKRVRYYLVSNEVDHDVGYNVPIYKKSYVVRYDDYEKVLAAAYRAIKAVDKGLLVLDHGTSSYSLCLAVASAYAETGRVDQAIAFLRGMRNGGTSGWADSAKAVYALRRPENARRIEFAKATMRRAGRCRVMSQRECAWYVGPYFPKEFYEARTAIYVEAVRSRCPGDYAAASPDAEAFRRRVGTAARRVGACGRALACARHTFLYASAEPPHAYRGRYCRHGKNPARVCGNTYARDDFLPSEEHRGAGRMG